MKNPYIIPAAMICAAILAGFWILKPSSEQPQKVIVVQPPPPPPPPPDISILDAADAGNIEAVKQHLDAGTDVNTKLGSGWTPLHFAADRGHKEVAELLIDNGADVNAKNKQYSTPLLYATGQGHKEIVELLISKGVDVNAITRVGTPLDSAIEYNQPEIADLLRKHGAKESN